MNFMYVYVFLDCSANVTLIGNGFCNNEVNHADCNYDGGDCACSGDTVKDGADNCNCPGQTENDGANNCACSGDTVNDGSDNCLDPSSCEFLVSTNVKLSVQYVFLWFCFNFPTVLEKMYYWRNFVTISKNVVFVVLVVRIY